MKKFIIALTAIMLFTTAIPCQAASKLEKRYAYTLKKLRLDKATEAKFAPVLKAYLTEKKEANKKYDDLKDKYKQAEKAGTLTDAQATQLLDAKFECEVKETAVKKKFYTEFLKVLKPKKAYYAFDFSNDKMSKIEGERNGKDED